MKGTPAPLYYFSTLPWEPIICHLLNKQAPYHITNIYLTLFSWAFTSQAKWLGRGVGSPIPRLLWQKGQISCVLHPICKVSGCPSSASMKSSSLNPCISHSTIKFSCPPLLLHPSPGTLTPPSLETYSWFHLRAHPNGARFHFLEAGEKRGVARESVYISTFNKRLWWTELLIPSCRGFFLRDILWLWHHQKMESAKYVHFLSSHNIHFPSVNVSCFSFPVLLPHNGANFCSGQRKYKQSMDLEYEQGLQAYWTLQPWGRAMLC